VQNLGSNKRLRVFMCGRAVEDIWALETGSKRGFEEVV
jgi:hypothetical protein